MKDYLLIGPYTPRQCGIASHIVQLEDKLLSEGMLVDTAGPPDCNANYKIVLNDIFSSLRLLRIAHLYKSVNIHFYSPEFFNHSKKFTRIFNFIRIILFGLMLRNSGNIRIYMHETPSTKFFFQRSFLHRWMWNQAHKIIFFTDKERLNFINSYNFRVINNTFVEHVNSNFIKFTNRSPIESSLHLNLPLTNKIRLLCIGFIQKNKGYDRAIRLFNKNNYNNLELYITGSAKVDDNQSVEYLKSLIELSKSKNIFITANYISNQDFDDWINSCNYLLFPYVEIFNSGVLGRAKLFNKISILSNVGGLADQSNHGDMIFNGDNELEEILFKINGLCIK